jgi:hypothetical protein
VGRRKKLKNKNKYGPYTNQLEEAFSRNPLPRKNKIFLFEIFQNVNEIVHGENF